MRVLLVHNFYHVTGGSDRCFFDLNKLLESKGHEVIPFSTKNPQNYYSAYSEYFVPQLDFNVSQKKISQIKSFINMIYSFPAKRALEKLLNHIRPDVVHLHNIYGRISPSILALIKKYRIPIVQTLHDTKIVCPNHRMFANGSICEECRGNKYYRAIIKRCNHGSALFGSALALEAYVHRWLNIYQKHIDAFISPSNFLRDKLVEHGIDSQKIFVLPNFIFTENSYTIFTTLEPSIDGIYFGSLIPEKGVEVLIRSLIGLKGGRFRIVGEGYRRKALEKIVKDEVPIGGPSIEFVGHLDAERLKKEISNSLMVIVPSICYDNAPMAVLEAFSQGKPVVGSIIGGIPELIIEDETGLLFEPGDSNNLRRKILELLNDKNRTLQMGRNAKKWVKENRNSELYFKQLMSLYAKLGVRA